MRSREKRNLVSSKDEKKQHRVRVLRGEGECIRKIAFQKLTYEVCQEPCKCERSVPKISDFSCVCQMFFVPLHIILSTMA